VSAETTSSSTVEKIVVAVLAAMAIVLGYVRFAVLAERRRLEEIPFDWRNPMLDARLGECVEIEDSGAPGQVQCITVAAPGVVLRPPSGPRRIGIYTGLDREPAYVATALHAPAAGEGCESASGAAQDHVLYALNGFGMPLGSDVDLHSLRPVTKTWGGRESFTYEVQMMRYGTLGGLWVLWLAEDAPVTGTVYRRHTIRRGDILDVVFRPLENCPTGPGG
jgi:hypothetical protein